MNTPIRTHTYWMNIKEYKKWSKNNLLNIHPICMSSNRCIHYILLLINLYIV